MTEHSFSLVPFPDSNLPEIQITGNIVRKGSMLSIHYLLNGNTRDILVPEKQANPTRKSELWLRTCFEFFLSLPDQPPYWEFNLSPSGDWNVYRMDSYRRVGFREEYLIRQLAFEVEGWEDGLSVHGRMNLVTILESGQPIQAGITSVIQTRHGHVSYWALHHPGPQADFHRKESFSLML